MNLLITSCGRRTEIIKYFKNELNGEGRVVAVDCDSLAPALYFADKYYITEKISDESYIDTLLKICKEENIKGILSLIDPELSLLSKNINKFEENGIKIFQSSFEACEICFDKYKMFNFLRENGFKGGKTYIDLDEFREDFKNGSINFPVFVKPRCGSASLGINKVEKLEHLELLFALSKDLIIQEFLDGQEYGVDCYVDFLSKEVVSIFAKKKIRMRSGETDKAVSVKDKKLFALIERLVLTLGLKGPLDIDVFNINGQWFISEINPRFGGGYPLAYGCGENFPKFLVNNLNLKENKKQIGSYKENVFMMKHDILLIK